MSSPSQITVFTTAPGGDFTLNAETLAAMMGESGGSGIISTAITAAGNGTLTAASLVGGQIVRTGPTAAYTDTTDTAANIAAALGSVLNVGQTFLMRIKNATKWPQTLAAGAGVTLPGTILIPPFSIGNYFATMGGTQASPTVVMAHLSTVPIHVSAIQSNPQPTALTTVGAGTITAAGIAGGYTVRTGSTAAFTDTTDSVANLITALAAFLSVGGSIEWTYVNNTVAAATLQGASNVSFVGGTTVLPNSWARYIVSLASGTTVTFTCIEQGYFPHYGTFVANGATPVVVADANVTATSNITISLKTVGGTVSPALPALNTVTPGTGFHVTATASDTSTYNYEIRG